MTTTAPTIDLLEPEESARFDEIITSFFAPTRTMRRVRRFGPIGLIVIVQILLSVRLQFPLSQDEALYLNDGHYLLEHWQHGTAMPDHPANYFSGVPVLYPVFAALLDSVGGITLVRLFSLLCMIVATLCVFAVGRELFSRSAGLLGALLFATSAPVLFLGRYATYDALSVALLAAAAYLTCRSGRRSCVLVGIAIGFLLALAALVKYAAGAFVPGLLALVLVVGWRRSARRGVVRTALAAATAGGILLIVDLVWGRTLKAGLTGTTTERTPVARLSRPELVGDIARWVGPVLAISVLAAFAAAVATRRVVLVAVLLLTSLTADLYQLRIREYVSLFKHVGFGLILGAPLAAAGLLYFARWLSQRVASRAVPALVLVVCVWAPLIDGLSASRSFADGVKDVSGNVTPWVTRELRRDPNAYVIADYANVTRYLDRPRASFSHVTDTTFIDYHGRHGLAGFEAALRDHHFSLVVLNTTATPVSRALTPLMHTFGYRLVSSTRVEKFGTARWEVWRPLS